MAKKKTKPKQPEATFEESLAALERIVAELEGGELGLAEALERYERGVGCLKRCQEQLHAVERRIELLSGVDADGNPVARPLDEHEAESLDEKASTRSRRRGGGAGRKGGVDEPGGLF